MRRTTHRLTALLSTALLVAGALAIDVMPAAAKSCRTWGAQPPNEGTDDNRLEAVSLVSACEGWAVGSYYHALFTADQTLIERWNGTAWKIVSSPNAGGANQLRGVSAVSSNLAWAVGNSTDGSADQTLVLRWNGTQWSVKPSPNVGGSNNDNVLEAVSAISGSKAWAVGSYADGGAFRTLILRWNGTEWRRMTSPNVGSGINELKSVVALSPSDVWAVGRYYDLTDLAYRTLILHWNGNAWKRVKSPNVGTGDNTLEGVAASSGSNIWAVGHSFGDTSYRTLILRWNGTAWKRVKSPSRGPYNNDLFGVAVTGGSNAWAVGRWLDNSSGSYRSLILHWNGSRWRVQAHPSLGSESSFGGIAATSSTNAWGVGSYSVAPTQNLAMHCC